MSHNESKVDVLVVGAGPAGLMCAHGLVKFGVTVKVIDQRASKVTAGQADGIQPRTIEVLQSYGLADRLLREGNQMHMAAFYNPGTSGGIERTGCAPDVTAPTARFPFEVTLHQGAIEAIFLDSMRNYGLEPDRPVIPASLHISDHPTELADPQSHPVKVVLKHLDGDQSTHVVRAKYVVGADGGHSWVRRTLDIAMEGEQTDYIWGVIDTIPETDFPDIRNRCVIHSSNGSCMVIPREDDKVRLYLQLTEADVINGGRIDKTKVNVQKLLAVAKKLLQPYHIDFPHEIDWWTVYIIGQRVAASFQRRERVFIAGDACHTHSPKAGQGQTASSLDATASFPDPGSKGMNASMNDAHNLAWKITQVLRGWSNPSILSTYEFERRKYAQDLIAFDRQFSALFSGKPRTDEFQDGVSHEEFLKAFQTFGGFTSGIGIHYAPSVITNARYQDAAKNLIIGERIVPQVLVRAADRRPYEIQDLLPADVRFKVLVFVGETASVTNGCQHGSPAKLSADLQKLLNKYSRTQKLEVLFDVFSISPGTKQSNRCTSSPPIMWLHWSKVFVDQKELHGDRGGKAYSTYGISPAGAVVVVRPDGYVGAVAPLNKVEHLDEYFAGFMNYP